MEEWMEAAIFFWTPLFIMLLGFWMSISRASEILNKVGKIFLLFGFIFFAVSPWTAAKSDSTASAHLLLSVLGSIGLLVFGVHNTIFSGDVPVGPLPRSARISGALMIVASLGWLAYMHWINPPQWRNDVNPYWLVYWPTSILFSASLSGIGCIAFSVLGDERRGGSLLMGTLCVIFSTFAILMMMIDGANTSAEDFRHHVWLASADILGSMAGVGAAIIVFAGVIVWYESGLENPDRMDPPSQEDLEFASSRVSKNLGGNTDEG